MSHSFRSKLFGTAFAAVLVLTTSTCAVSADKVPLTMEAIFAGSEFRSQSLVSVHWLADSSGFTFLQHDDETGLAESYLRTDEEADPRQLLSSEELRFEGEFIEPSDIVWNSTTTTALIRGPVTTTWHGYQQAAYYVYEADGKRIRQLAQGNPAVEAANLSPDAKRVGYVLNNNLYMFELESGHEKAITDDGNNAIFNGTFDYGSFWFGAKAWFWSPDSEHIAFWRIDASEVNTFPLINELVGYSEVREFRYPNAGDPHALYRIGVYDLDDETTTWLNTNHDPDDYLAGLKWAPESDRVFVQQLARDHQTLNVLEAPVSGDRASIVLTDTDPAWIDVVDDLTPLGSEGEKLLWTSERSGFNHIYLYQEDGKHQAVTSGDWTVVSLLEVDEANRQIYFYGKRSSLIDQHVYRVDFSGENLQRVTNKAGWHEWRMSPDGQKTVAKHSDARTPPTESLIDLATQSETALTSSDVEGMRKYAMPHTEFVSFETDDGVTLNGYLIKPLDFDPGKKYPVVSYAYGNAGSQIVVNRWGTQRGPAQDLWHRYMAQQGYIIFAMDNRTTTGRGKIAKNLTYGEYGKYAVLDHLQGVNYLKSLPWVDGSRIGFWGWSGGGYLAAALMTKGAPHIKTAVSVAPVINLNHYQVYGVERWMGSPHTNQAGYDRVNPMNYVDKLEGKLLLVHGTGDENVKFAFTLQFADALIKAGKQFDMMVYPNERHAIANSQLHVFSTMTRYFDENL